MPDISIRIVADPSGAKQGLKDVQNDLQKLGTTMKEVMKVSAKGFRPFGNETDASKDLEKYSLRIKAMSNAMNAFVSRLDRPEDQIKAWRKQLSFFQKEYMELLTQGKFSFDGGDRLGNQMLGNIEETEKRIAEIRKAVDKEKALSKKAREGADAEQLELLGTKYQKVTAEIEKHRKVLNAFLVEKHREGKASDDLKKKIDAEVASIKKLTKEQEKASKTSFLSKMLSIAKNIMGFQMAIALFRKTTTAITQTLKESVQAAAEAEQVYSKLGTVFEGVAGSMDKARDVAASIGVANSTAASALSTVGDLLQAQGMGATESLQRASKWVKQFQDIIAFKDVNMSLEEFAQNFMSGAAGNLRNFRTFGSIVKESAVQAELLKRGLDGLTDSQLELAKMTIRAEMALEQQANAMGATEREWDTALSVSRRLNEAWKEFKENLGDTLIRFVNPIRRGITEILEDANKANRAMKGEAVYAGANEVGSKDYERLVSDILTAKNNVKGDKDLMSPQLLRTYLATYKDLPSGTTLDYMFQSEGQLKQNAHWYRPIVDSAVEAIKAEREQEAAMKATAEALAIANDNLDKYREGLESIKGVGSLEKIILGDVDNLDNGKDLLSRLAINALGTQDVGTFVDRMAKAFDSESATNDGYKAWLNSIRQLYTLVETEDPGSILAERLLRLYEEVTNRQKDFNDELERGRNFATALENIDKGTNDYRSKTAQVGMTDLGKALYALEEQHKKDLELADSANAVTAVNEAYALQKDAIYDYYSKLSLLAAETEDEALAEEARAALTELENKRITELIQAEKELKDTIKGDFVSMFGKAGAFTEALGAFAQNHDMNDAKGLQNAKDLWSALFAILKETKAFQKVLEGTEVALSGLDSILEPFIPYIEMVNRQTQQLMQVLRPLIPVMKVFASIMTIVQVSIIHSTTVIAEAMTWVVGLADKLLDLINRPAKKAGSIFGGLFRPIPVVGDFLGNAVEAALGGTTGAVGSLAKEFTGFMDSLGLPTTESLLKDMGQTLEDIWNTEEEIRFNTEDSDLSKILEELNYLYGHGIIDANTYNARVNRVTGGNYLDTVGSGGLWNNGFSAGARTNNISITINGAGLNKDELDAVLSSALSRVTGNTVHVDTRRASFAY